MAFGSVRTPTRAAPEFQHDYRNGVKPWQFDPTKWLIWILAKFGITSSLRRVPPEKIAAAEQAVSTRLSS